MRTNESTLSGVHNSVMKQAILDHRITVLLTEETLTGLVNMETVRSRYIQLIFRTGSQ